MRRIQWHCSRNISNFLCMVV